MATTYKEDVLGKYVVVQFLVNNNGTRRPFLGTITEYKVALLEDGNLETEHMVLFDDGDRVWFDLTREERMNRLTWVNGPSKEEDDDEEEEERPAKKKQRREDIPAKNARPYRNAAAAAAARTHGTSRTTPTSSGRWSKAAAIDASAAAMVTPNQSKPSTLGKRKKPSRSTSSGALEAQAHARRVPGSSVLDPGWLQDMEYWMLNIPHGRNRAICSHKNAQNMMSKIRKLASGEGLACTTWPAGVRFYSGVKVNLSYDFEKMLEEAKQMESKYGKDKGGGHALCHPLRKINVYKSHLLLGN